MILLFLFFIAIVNPYIYYAYFFNKKTTNDDYKEYDGDKFNVFIKSTNFGNPFNLEHKFKLNIIFELPKSINPIEYNSTFLSEQYTIEDNKIHFSIYNKDLHKIHTFIHNVYPTYCRINFVYYEERPYVNILLKNEIDKFNLDTTRNYYLINLYIISLYYEYNKNYVDKNKLITIDHSKNYITDILDNNELNYLYDILL